MNILITGGAGFIGSNFIYFTQDKYPHERLVCFDALTYAASPMTLHEARNHSNFRFVKGDVCDRDAVFKLFREEKFDIVVNFAAQTHVDRSVNESSVFFHTNLLGTQTLLDACREYGIRRFHQISTDEVYGDLPLEGNGQCFTEESLLRPSSPYSASKAAADLLTLAYYRTFNIPVTITRSSNNYGPYCHPEKLIPLTITKALKNQTLPVYGNGKNMRDWLHVHDHCRALDCVIRNGRTGEVYNIAGGNERSNLDVVGKILQILDKPESLITFVPDRPGHDQRYSMNCQKLKGECHWVPLTDFEIGLRTTVEWYIKNRAWWESIKE